MFCVIKYIGGGLIYRDSPGFSGRVNFLSGMQLKCFKVKISTHDYVFKCLKKAGKCNIKDKVKEISKSAIFKVYNNKLMINYQL